MTQWNFTIQHTFGASNLVEVAYLGSQGHKLENRYDADQCVPDASLLCDPATRPYPQYAGLLIFDNDGNSNYNALVVKYNHQFSRGLTVLAEYTYSKTIMDSWEGDGTDSQIATCRKCDRGPATFSFPQSLYISTVYDLPFGHGLRFGSDWSKAVDLFLGGWRITGIASFVSGQSFSITAPNTTSSLFSGVKADRLCDGADSYDRHNLRSDGGVFFNTACFAQPLPAHFGNSGRGIFVGPGGNNWDLGLEKDFALYERFRMQLRGEFFNAFNHAQFEDPGSTVGGVNFGVVTTARDPREIQLAAKFLW